MAVESAEISKEVRLQQNHYDEIFAVIWLILLLLPDLFRGMGAWRKTM